MNTYEKELFNDWLRDQSDTDIEHWLQRAAGHRLSLYDFWAEHIAGIYEIKTDRFSIGDRNDHD